MTTVFQSCLLPTLHLSVKSCPWGRLRHRYSSRSHAAFHRYTSNSHPLQDSSLPVFECSSCVGPGITSDLTDRLRARFTPSNSINACTSVATAVAGTELVGASSAWVTSIAVVIKPNTFLLAEHLQPEGLLHTRGMAASGLRPLCNIPHCCLP